MSKAAQGVSSEAYLRYVEGGSPRRTPLIGEITIYGLKTFICTAQITPPALFSSLPHPLDEFVFCRAPAPLYPSPGPAPAAGSARPFGFAGAAGPFDSAGSFGAFGSAGIPGSPGAAGSAGLADTRRSFSDPDTDDKPRSIFDVGFYSWCKGYTWVERLCCPPTACNILNALFGLK